MNWSRGFADAGVEAEEAKPSHFPREPKLVFVNFEEHLTFI